VNNKRFYLMRTLLMIAFIVQSNHACRALQATQTIYKGVYLSDFKNNWQIKKQISGDQSTTDLITNGDISIELNFFDKKTYFTIQIKFIELKNSFVLHQPNININTKYGDILKQKIINCTYYSNKISSKGGTVVHSSFKDQIKIDNNLCYYLIFDHQPPPLEEEIVLNLSKSLTIQGEYVDIPPVYFRKTVKDIYRFGLFQ